MELDDFIGQLLALVRQGELAIALERLTNYLKGAAPALVGEALLYSSQLVQLDRDLRKGVMAAGEGRVVRARLTAAAIEFIQELPTRACRPVDPGSSVTISGPLDNFALEKIFGVNHLKSIAWLRQGIAIARSVCRIVSPRGLGSGFVIEGGIVVTNHHVVATAEEADASIAEFGFEEDQDGVIMEPVSYQMKAETFRTSSRLDVSRVALRDGQSSVPIHEWGSCRLGAGVPAVDDHVTIVQHPDGGPKMIAITANQVVNIYEHRLQYLTDTMPGSSGAPVFNDRWEVVAVHHAGGNVLSNASGQRRFANEGILISFVTGLLGL